MANLLQGGGTSQSILAAFSGSHHNSMATLRRKRRNSYVPNAKRMFDEVRNKYWQLAINIRSSSYTIVINCSVTYTDVQVVPRIHKLNYFNVEKIFTGYGLFLVSH